jgi:hypothetical protein
MHSECLAVAVPLCEERHHCELESLLERDRMARLRVGFVERGGAVVLQHFTEPQPPAPHRDGGSDREPVEWVHSGCIVGV